MNSPNQQKFVVLVLSFIALLSSCTSQNTTTSEVEKPTIIESLVTTQWLSEHMNDPNLVILDSTVLVKMDSGNMSNISGRDLYEKGHIPKAQFADLKKAMSDSESSFDFVMPSPEQFAKALGELGIDNQSKVVVYSAENHVWATRMWWMLRWAGLEQVAVLDGGLQAWKAENRPISNGTPKPPVKEFKISLRPELIASRDEVFNAISDDSVNIVDALPAASYNGKFSMYARPGHIPTASNMPTSDLVNETGHYKSIDELDMRQEQDRAERVITYCGGGVAATGAAFTLHRLGFKDVAVYMGSLQEWAPDTNNPMTTEPE